MLPRVCVSLAVLPALLLTAPAFAAGDGESTPLRLESEAPAQAVQAASSGPGGGSILRAFFGLIVVVGLIYGLTWVLKQMKASKEEKHSGTGLRSLATLPLGPNRSLHLIRAGRELVLVGVGEAGVTPIRTYTQDEAERLGLFDAGEQDAPAPAVKAVAGTMLEQLRRRTVIR